MFENPANSLFILVYCSFYFILIWMFFPRTRNLKNKNSEFWDIFQSGKQTPIMLAISPKFSEKKMENCFKIIKNVLFLLISTQEVWYSLYVKPPYQYTVQPTSQIFSECWSEYRLLNVSNFRQKLIVLTNDSGFENFFLQ